MIASLLGQGCLDETADFIVIGAGTVGLSAAVQMTRQAVGRVIVLESGGEHQAHETHPLNDVVQRGTRYEGADHGRFRCLGGTSTRWGGALIPFQEADLVDAGWPISIAELEPYLRGVETFFGLEAGPYEDMDFPFDLGPDYVNRLAKWPAFKKRNVANLVGREARARRDLPVWLDATVTGIEMEGAGVSVLARSPSGDSIRVSAPKLIVAAGAIETTRLALLIDRQTGGAIRRNSPSLGCYFTDHLSTMVAEIEPRDITALNRILGFRFSRSGGMRNIRFELAPDAAARRSLPPCFAHVSFDVTRPGGFDALRDIFRCLQKRRLPPPSCLLDLLRDAPWLSRAVWWRFVDKRLLFPAHSRLSVHMVVEQRPLIENTITLSESQSDVFGVPKAEICWSVSADDIHNINRLTDLFEQTWSATEFAHHGSWKRLPRDQVAGNLAQSGGIYHPTGSTRMGRDAGSGVVDSNLRLFAFPQVQLLSTSVLPSGGGANPTMMLLLLAMRCVDQHAVERKHRPPES